MKNKKNTIAIALFIMLLVFGFAGYKAYSFAMEKYHFLREKITEIDANTSDHVNKYDFEYSWAEGNTLVAHAYGGKGSKSYTNALEAFVYNYELGHRVFEVDFDLTTDGQTICCHDEEWWRYITNN